MNLELSCTMKDLCMERGGSRCSRFRGCGASMSFANTLLRREELELGPS